MSASTTDDQAGAAHPRGSGGARTDADSPWSLLVVSQNRSGHRPGLRTELSAHTNDLIGKADSNAITIGGDFYNCLPKYC